MWRKDDSLWVIQSCFIGFQQVFYHVWYWKCGKYKLWYGILLGFLACCQVKKLFFRVDTWMSGTQKAIYFVIATLGCIFVEFYSPCTRSNERMKKNTSCQYNKHERTTKTGKYLTLKLPILIAAIGNQFSDNTGKCDRSAYHEGLDGLKGSHKHSNFAFRNKCRSFKYDRHTT